MVGLWPSSSLAAFLSGVSGDMSPGLIPPGLDPAKDSFMLLEGRGAPVDSGGGGGPGGRGG